MAKAEITCTCAGCGKTFEVERSFSNRRSADEWVEWATSHEYYTECPECYRKRMIQRREDQNKLAAGMSADMGLPELSGSEKQIAWAVKIRFDWLMGDYCHFDKLQDEGKNIIMEWLRLDDHTTAKFWIENRDKDHKFLKMIDDWYRAKTENTAEAVPSVAHWPSSSSNAI